MKQTKDLLKHCTGQNPVPFTQRHLGCLSTICLVCITSEVQKVTKIITEFVLSEIAVEFLDSCIEEKGIMTNATFASEVQLKS